MPVTRLIQTNFTAGELSPRLAGRVDVSKYYNGAKTLENFIVLPHGGITRRPGTYYIAEVKDSTKKVRLVAFEFSTEQAYVLEFGDQYMRVFKDGGSVRTVDSYTKLLLHFNGINASTTITDDGNTGHTVTATGNAQLYTGIYRYGLSCLSLDGSGDYLSVPDHADWFMSTGKFTIDFYCVFNEDPTAAQRVFFSQQVDANNYVYFGTSSTGPADDLRLEIYSGGGLVILLNIANSGLFTQGAWQHIAVIRGWGGNANDWAICVDGVAVATATNSGTWPDLGAAFQIGAMSGGNSFKGFIEEFRVSKGIARWTANFARPNSPYPYEDDPTYSGGGDGGVYELATTYLEGDLPNLKFAQSADTLYIAHPNFFPRKLTRADHDDWTIQDVAFRPGPSVEIQPWEPNTTITPAATTGTGINFTAGAASTWLPGDVGRQIVSGAQRAIIVTYTSDTVVVCDIVSDFDSTDPIASGDWQVEGSPTGSVTPSAVGPVGTVITLTNALNAWRSGDTDKYVFINDGVIDVTSVTSNTVLKGEVLKELSASDASTSWWLEEAAWTATLGYPRAVEFFESRLYWGGVSSFPQSIWASVVADFENLTVGIDDDDALQYTLSKFNVVRWIHNSKVLFLGTSGSVMRIGSREASSPTTPTNIVVQEESGFGSSDLQPVKVGDTLLFVERLGRKVRELRYNLDVDGYSSNDMTILSDHITASGIIGMAYQKHPNSILWCVTSDGVLIGMTYQREHEVVAWHKHPIAGTDMEVESICCIPSTTEDEIYLVVKRTINGSTVRYIERLKTILNTEEGDVLADAFFVDCGLTYDGSAATTISGLDHLEGEAVDVLADGSVITGKTVSSGAITLSTAASEVHIGLNYNSNLEPMRVGRTPQGQIIRVSEIVARVHESLELKAGVDSSNLVALDFTADELNTKDIFFLHEGAFDTDGYTYIRQDQPLPCTILALIYKTEVSQE